MVHVTCTGGKRFGITFLGPNVISSYGCWPRRNVLHGRIFVKEAFKDLPFVSYAHIMRSLFLTCFFFSPFPRKYGIDGGKPGVRVVFMQLPLLIFGKDWADLQQRLLSYRVPGLLGQFLFSGTFGWRGIEGFFVTLSWIVSSYGGRFFVSCRRLFLLSVTCL